LGILKKITQAITVEGLETMTTKIRISAAAVDGFLARNRVVNGAYLAFRALSAMAAANQSGKTQFSGVVEVRDTTHPCFAIPQTTARRRRVPPVIRRDLVEVYDGERWIPGAPAAQSGIAG
jgi:hypothetical protein